MPYCEKCGEELADRDRFCTKCGLKVEAPPVVSDVTRDVSSPTPSNLKAVGHRDSSDTVDVGELDTGGHPVAYSRGAERISVVSNAGRVGRTGTRPMDDVGNRVLPVVEPANEKRPLRGFVAVLAVLLIAVATAVAILFALGVLPPSSSELSSPDSKSSQVIASSSSAAVEDSVGAAHSDSGESADASDGEGDEKAVVPKSMGQLLSDLVASYESPTSDNVSAIDADLDSMQAGGSPDYDVAKAVVDNWDSVYANSNYRLICYTGGTFADELANTSIPNDETHAFVVLGCALVNGEMQDELVERCEVAAAAARSYPNAVIICSGGASGENNPNGITEAYLMKEYLVRWCGIDRSRIYADVQGTSTSANATLTVDLLRSMGIETMTLVTSSYHQQRAQAVYNAAIAYERERSGYTVNIAANYNYKSDDNYLSRNADARTTALQIGEVLNLPSSEIALIPDPDTA